MPESTNNKPTASSKPATERVLGSSTVSSTIGPNNKPPAGRNFLIGLAFFAGIFGGVIGGGIFSTAENQTDNLSPEATTQFISGESDLIAKVAEEVGESVVSITSTSTTGRGLFSFQSEGAGTGIILTDDGIIVTNKHVVPADVTAVSVVFSDGTVNEDVEVVGRDPFNDIAYLKVSGVSGLKPAKLGDSAEVRVGEKVIAIGNALGQYDNTVTSGIISGLSRPVVTSDADGSNAESLQGLFQTDTSINPGNSGGPLVNLDGEVIGINTAIAGNAENIGFSIPINDAKGGFDSVVANGELIKPYIGIRYVSVDNQVASELSLDPARGAYVVDEPGAIVNDGPADKAGIQRKDHLLSVNGKEINEASSLVQLVSQYQVGEQVEIELIRNGQNQNVTVTLEEVPGNF